MNTTLQPLVAQAQGGNSGVSLEMRSIGGRGGVEWSHKLQEECRGYSLGDDIADRRELEREQL